MASRLRRAALGLLVASAVVLAAEGLARLTMPMLRTASLPDTMIRTHLENPGFRYDPDLYWYWAMLPSAAMQINEHGFRRVTPMTVSKPPGVTRAAVFGDSQTLGAGLGPESTYSAVAERLLTAEGAAWEVLNAGISGFRSLNVLRLLELRMAPYELDYIVVDCMPFDSPHDDGHTVGRPSERGIQAVRALLWQSRLFHILELGIDQLRPGTYRWLDHPAVPPGRLGLGNHDGIVAWAQAHGAVPVFMQYPVKAEHGQVGCHTLPGELPSGFPIVPACDALRRDGRHADLLFQDANHLTEAGAEVVGKALATTLAGLAAEGAGPAAP